MSSIGPQSTLFLDADLKTQPNKAFEAPGTIRRLDSPIKQRIEEKLQWQL